MLKLKKIKPLHNKLVTTAERYEDEYQNGLLVKTNGSIKEFQKVIAVGEFIKEIKEGDLVCINPARYLKKKYDNSVRDEMDANPVVSVNIPTIELNDVQHFLLDTSDIDYVITEWEDIKEDTNKINLIMPKAPKIQL